jgi:hypothetical protein
MMRYLPWICALGVAVGTSAEGRAEDPPAHLLSNDFAFDGLGGSVLRQTVPVRVDNGWTLTGVEEPWDIHRAGLRDDTTRNAVHIRSAGGNAVAITVTDGSPSGTYAVAFRLDLRGPPPRDGGSPEDRTVDVTANVKIAAPAITATKSLDIRLIDLALPWIDLPERKPRLVLDETTQRAGVSGLVVAPIGGLTQDGVAAPGTLQVTHDQFDAGIPRGGHASGIATATDVPLGTSEGTFQIVAPDLAAPLTVAVHVVRRRGVVEMVLVFAFGAALGWLLRKQAQKMLDVSDSVDTANDVLEQLREVAQRARATERGRAARAAAAMATAGRTGKKAEIDDAVGNAKTDITDIKTELQGQVQKLHGELKQRTSAAVLSALPSPVRSQLDRAARRVEAVEAALVAVDVAAADAALASADSLLTDAARALEPAVADLRGEVAKLVAAKRYALASLRDLIDAINAKTSSVPFDVASQPSVPTSLSNADEAWRETYHAVREASVRLVAFADEVSTTIMPQTGDPVTRATTLHTGDGSAVALVRGLRATVIALYKEVATRTSNADDALANGEFLAPLRDAAGKPPSTAGTDVHLGELDALASQLPRADVAVVPTPAPPRELPAVPPITYVRVPGVAEWIVVTARIGQGVVAVLMLGLGLWYLYGDTFVGTNKEVIAFLATGFFTDLSFASATDLFSKLKTAK